MKTQKASVELQEMLNKAIAREIQVAVQYMWQHVQWSGIKAFAVKDTLKEIAIVEMKHAEMIAERLSYLGGIPTTKPDPIFVGSSLQEMLKNDAQAEEEAIDLYRQIITFTREQNDEVTNRMFRQILADEEDHHDTFISLLEDF